MADEAILNVAFSFGPIHRTVNRVTHPVSTEFFALGLSKTMLWSDDPSSEIVTGVYTSSIFVHIVSNIACYNINYLDKSIMGFHKVIPQLVEIAGYDHTTFWVFSH